MPAKATTTAYILTASAPELGYSPYAGAYLSNVIEALEVHTNAAGNSATPGYFQSQSTISINKILDTSGMFKSWNGVANPSNQFSGEYGGQFNATLHVVSTVPFPLSGVRYSFTDFNNIPVVDTFESLTTGYTKIGKGINYGPDGIRGTSDDTVYTDGNLNTLVNEISIVGVSWSIQPSGTGTPQEILDHTMSILNTIAPFNGNNSYQIWAGSTLLTSVSSITSFTQVPEPSTSALLTLIGIGTIGRVILRRRIW